MEMNIASKGKKGKKNFLNITFESGFLDKTSPSRDHGILKFNVGGILKRPLPTLKQCRKIQSSFSRFEV